MAKRVSNKSRVSNSQIAHLACLEEGQANQTEQIERIVRALEGNSHPGLLQRQTVTEGLLSEIQKDLAAHTATLGQMEKNQGHLQDLVEAHLSPHNPEHKTLASAWERNPWNVVKLFGIIAGVLYLAVQTGFLGGVLRILGMPNP